MYVCMYVCIYTYTYIYIHKYRIINLSMKLDTFTLQYKKVKLKPLFKKGIKTEAKNYRLISVAFNIEGDRKTHSVADLDYSYSLRSNTVPNQILEQIIPQTHVCLN